MHSILSNYIRNKISREEVRLLDLVDFPIESISPGMYEKNGMHSSIRAIQETYFLSSDKYIFVIPEYNGGSPGILKLLIDALSVENYKQTFGGKKALLIGISTGRAGNLRGIEQFTSILNYLGVIVYPTKQPVSRFATLLNGNNEIVDEGIDQTLSILIDEFIAF
jgi:NAD(P)H-dependent FMN reductase